MTIKTGDSIPPITLFHKPGNEVVKIDTNDIFKGKKVVLFALPGAFTPTCSAAHLPGYVVHADSFFQKGVDSIVCLSINDAHVMKAWGEDQNVDDRIMMIADGNGELTNALGMEIDRREVGMGIRSQRYAMIVNDGVVEVLNIEEPGKFEVSDAETMLAAF